MWKAVAAPRVAAVASLLVAVLLTATCSRQEAEPIDVSVRDVVIDPYAVDGKRVRLIGLLHRSADGDALYWHEADIEHLNRSHGVAVHVSSGWPEGAEQRGTYVAVEGIFEADARGVSRISTAHCSMPPTRK